MKKNDLQIANSIFFFSAMAMCLSVYQLGEKAVDYLYSIVEE